MKLCGGVERNPAPGSGFMVPNFLDSVYDRFFVNTEIVT